MSTNGHGGYRPGAGRPRKNAPPRPKYKTPTGKSHISRAPTAEQIEQLREELTASSYIVPGDVAEFQEWLREKAEVSLHFFTKWIFYQEQDRRQKLGKIHSDIASFVTDYSTSRRKLLMLPMGHLKTSFCSHALPLHLIISRPETNIYFPGEWGCDQRIMLGNENEDKCLENLSVIRQHLESNVWIAWLWPHACWENPETEAPVWRELKLTVPRKVTYAEPTLTACGAKTGIVGRHYDIELLDDIAGAQAGGSWEVMDKVKKFKKVARSRLHSRTRSIEIGLGTHQSADDVYVDWQKDSSVELMVRAIIEDGQPLWPENPDYSLEGIERMRAETDPILWALWYMNQPVASTFTAMDWLALREFRWDTQPGYLAQSLEFNENDVDRQLEVRRTILTANPLLRLAQGMPLERQKHRAMTIRRIFGGREKQSEAFLDHMHDKYGCPQCQHRNHAGYDCQEPECHCSTAPEVRPWELVLKGPL